MYWYLTANKSSIFCEETTSYLVAFGLVLERIEGLLHLIAVDIIVQSITLSMGDALRPRLLAA